MGARMPAMLPPERRAIAIARMGMWKGLLIVCAIGTEGKSRTAKCRIGTCAKLSAEL